MQGEEHTIVDTEVWTCCIMIKPVQFYNIKVFEHLWCHLCTVHSTLSKTTKHRELNLTQFRQPSTCATHETEKCQHWIHTFSPSSWHHQQGSPCQCSALVKVCQLFPKSQVAFSQHAAGLMKTRADPRCLPAATRLWSKPFTPFRYRYLF